MLGKALESQHTLLNLSRSLHDVVCVGLDPRHDGIPTHGHPPQMAAQIPRIAASESAVTAHGLNGEMSYKYKKRIATPLSLPKLPLFDAP